MDENLIHLQAEVEKTHAAAKGAVRKFYAQGLGEIDLNQVGPDKVEALEKLGMLVKKDKSSK